METIFIGAGATAFMDLWGLLRRRLLGIPLADYGLVGRWLAWMPRGRFIHRPIAATPAVPGERTIGWVAHYATGITFAALLVAFGRSDWLEAPTIGPALAVGLATVAAPFLLMQPGMGAGIAARRTKDPRAARVQSVLNHLVFGLGLYLSAALLRTLQLQ